jgi:hypothetical protein
MMLLLKEQQNLLGAFESIYLICFAIHVLTKYQNSVAKTLLEAKGTTDPPAQHQRLINPRSPLATGDTRSNSTDYVPPPRAFTPPETSADELA